MVGDAQAGESQHREVIGPVAHGHRLLEVDALDLAEKPQQLGLPRPVHNLSEIAPGKLAVLYFKVVGIDIVEAEAHLQIASEIGKSA